MEFYNHLVLKVVIVLLLLVGLRFTYVNIAIKKVEYIALDQGVQRVKKAIKRFQKLADVTLLSQNQEQKNIQQYITTTVAFLKSEQPQKTHKRSGTMVLALFTVLSMGFSFLLYKQQEEKMRAEGREGKVFGIV